MLNYKGLIFRSLIWRLVFILWIIPFALPGQDDVCSTIEDLERPAFYNLLNRNIQNRSFYSLALNINILTHDNGRRVMSESQVLEEIELVNKYYEEHNIFFEICGLNFIASSDLLQFHRTEDKSRISQYNEENKINLYIVEDIIKDDGGSSCGFADYPWSTSEVIVVKKSCITNSSTLAHELGHFLGLYHTHEARFGKELVDQSNCQISGDKICDTPADPQLSSNNINNDCLYIGEGTDVNNDFYDPDPSLLMSYSRKQCRNKLTPEQGAVMALSIETYYSEYLCATTSTIDHKDQQVRLFPNPTSGLLNIGNPKNFNISISVFSLQGKLLNANIYQKLLDITHLPSGIYLVQITDVDNNLNSLRKIVKY